MIVFETDGTAAPIPNPLHLAKGPRRFMEGYERQEPTNTWDPKEEGKEALSHFISSYVSKLYGVNCIRSWIKTNRGKFPGYDDDERCGILYCTGSE